MPKGVFITTSAYSAEALDYVNRIDTKVVLIDGRQLTELMIDFPAPRLAYQAPPDPPAPTWRQRWWTPGDKGR